MNKIKRPRDPNQLAKLIVDIAISGHHAERELDKPAHDGKDPAAVSLGRRGGLKGGVARAKTLTKKRRSEIAAAAAKARWAKSET